MAPWITVTLKIFGSEESLQVPVLQGCSVADLRSNLCKILDVPELKVEFHVINSKVTARRLRPVEEVTRVIYVKGIKSFGKQSQGYKNPVIIVGAGMYGLRQAIECVQQGLNNYVVVDKHASLGGSTWLSSANASSTLQSEGAQNQLLWLPDTMDVSLLSSIGTWPGKQSILKHMQDACDKWGITSSIRLSTQIMSTTAKLDAEEFNNKAYEFVTQLNDDSEAQDVLIGSCMTYYPECPCVPRRTTWPGEDTFGGQVNYGFSNEFDYSSISKQQVMIIGMGAFAMENLHTTLAQGASKVFVVARHVNLVLPRCASWCINQSSEALPASFLLDALAPMYDIVGWDAWAFDSVTGNADHTVASIRQEARWGICDELFLAVHFNMAEVIAGEVKRFKEKGAVLNSGRQLEGIDHVVKCLGFDGDLAVDTANSASYYHGFWVDGDFRRWCCCDQTSIYGSRFTSTAVSPLAASYAWTSLFYFQHPKQAKELAADKRMPRGTANAEEGQPGYLYSARAVNAIYALYTSFCPEVQANELKVHAMKTASMSQLCPADKFVSECKEEWSKLCKTLGGGKPAPDYPYTVELLQSMAGKAESYGKLAAVRIPPKTAKAASVPADTPGDELANIGTDMKPAMTALLARIHSGISNPTQQQLTDWFEQGKALAN